MELNEIGEEFKNKITAQDYSKKPQIDGVKFFDINQFAEDGGVFAELARLDDSGNMLAVPGFKVKQFNRSEMEPGTIKAWHLHFNQEDLWFVAPSDRLLVGLYDLRKNSQTYGVKMRFVLGAGKSRLLYIPRGVAHGVANLTNKTTPLIYVVNQFFDANALDERRLPWDFLGKEFWELQKG
jgi:dTDP-4-dehydrorhamnose 3,5-epimerase